MAKSKLSDVKIYLRMSNCYRVYLHWRILLVCQLISNCPPNLMSTSILPLSTYHEMINIHTHWWKLIRKYRLPKLLHLKFTLQGVHINPGAGPIRVDGPDSLLQESRNLSNNCSNFIPPTPTEKLSGENSNNSITLWNFL